MEKCVFCGWTRKTALPHIRFFGVPKEPGMKRIQWLYAIGQKEMNNRDRVCSVHFRSGRPSSDPSHEDFAPHLYLNSEPPTEVLQYLEKIVDQKVESSEPQFKASLNMLNTNKLELNKAPKPSILQRKRKMPSGQHSEGGDGSTGDGAETSSATRSIVTTAGGGGQGGQRRVRLQLLQKPMAEAAGVRAGQTVIIRRKAVIKTPVQ